MGIKLARRNLDNQQKMNNEKQQKSELDFWEERKFHHFFLTVKKDAVLKNTKKSTFFKTSRSKKLQKSNTGTKSSSLFQTTAKQIQAYSV